MSFVSFSDNFGQISLYQNYQLQGQFISKFEFNGAKKKHTQKVGKTACNEKTTLEFK